MTARIILLPDTPESSTRWWTVDCIVCGTQEGMREEHDHPDLVARRDEHNAKEHPMRPANLMHNDAMDHARSLRERGLTRHEFISAEEPKVIPRDLTIVLPSMLGPGNAYGTPEEFIRYVRAVNAVPEEATETAMSERDTIGGVERVRVTFHWWQVTLVVGHS